ncbi:MAG: DUF5611 family protein [Thermoplasmatota archaeon]
MEILDIKRGNYSNIEDGRLKDLMEEIFGNCREEEDDWLASEYGAMQPIKVKVLSKKELTLDINTVSIPDEQVLDTMKKRNQFLERATGFTSKQRLKRLKEKAKGGKL